MDAPPLNKCNPLLRDMNVTVPIVILPCEGVSTRFPFRGEANGMTRPVLYDFDSKNKTADRLFIQMPTCSRTIFLEI
jgi:hypothetical protein